MLTPKRHQLIQELILKDHMVTIQELVDLIGASESTIRRDLRELERQNKLVRVHGGASLKQSISIELSFPEKSSKNIIEKKVIAKYAATLVEEKDCIYLDAGTTTLEMIPYLFDKEIIVVTNGLTHLDVLSQYKINTYLLGGFVKHNTRALIGYAAQNSLNNYRFDKCFLGVNGIHAEYGYTTPDPEEAVIKKMALGLAQQSFVLADSSKLNGISFSKIAELEEATLIINQQKDDQLTPYTNKTNIKVVSS